MTRKPDKSVWGDPGAGATAAEAPGDAQVVCPTPGKQRILIVVADVPEGETGGAELQARYLAEAWAQQGHRVHMVGTNTARPEGGTEIRGELRIEWLRRPGLSRSGRREFDEIVQRVRPDICYLRYLKALWVTTPILKRHDVPWVYNFYTLPHCSSQWRCLLSMSPRGLRTYWRKSVLDELNKRYLPTASALIAQTEEQRASLAESYGLKARVVSNGHPVPVGPFRKATPPVVLWIGKSWKRPSAFVEAVERLRDTEASFVMVGSLPPELASAIDAGRWPNLRRTGSISPDEVNDLLEKAVAMVNTSPVEGFPNTFIQAWMRHAAVVSLSVDPDGVLANDGLGRCSGSVERMTDDIRALLADEPERLALVERAYDQAVRRHDLRRVAPRYESIFEEVLRSKGSAR